MKMEMLQDVVIQYPSNITEEEVNGLLSVNKSLGRLHTIMDLTIYELYDLEYYFNLTIKMGYSNDTVLVLERKG
jgi:hypothetical protein